MQHAHIHTHMHPLYTPAGAQVAQTCCIDHTFIRIYIHTYTHTHMYTYIPAGVHVRGYLHKRAALTTVSFEFVVVAFSPRLLGPVLWLLVDVPGLDAAEVPLVLEEELDEF
jgi:hypothetical protein